MEKIEYFPEINYDLQVIFINGISTLELLLNQFDDSWKIIKKIIKHKKKLKILKEKNLGI